MTKTHGDFPKVNSARDHYSKTLNALNSVSIFPNNSYRDLLVINGPTEELLAWKKKLKEEKEKMN